MKKLLGEGADPNTKDHAGWTPLVSESSTVDNQEFFLTKFRTENSGNFFSKLCSS